MCPFKLMFPMKMKVFAQYKSKPVMHKLQKLKKSKGATSHENQVMNHFIFFHGESQDMKS